MGPPAPRRGTDLGVAPASLELVARAQAGDAAAFGDLYDRYVGDVHRYIAYRVRGQALAEDLTSEAFTRALHRLETFHHQGPDLRAWLITIARNLVADHYKSSRYRLELVTDDVTASARPQLEEGPESVVLARMRTATLLDAVRQLRPEQQECIVLRFLQGLSVAETGQVMGKNVAAVRQLQHRAVRSLGRLLPRDGDL